jgi:hypothetical protein
MSTKRGWAVFPPHFWAPDVACRTCLLTAALKLTVKEHNGSRGVFPGETCRLIWSRSEKTSFLLRLADIFKVANCKSIQALEKSR